MVHNMPTQRHVTITNVIWTVPMLNAPCAGCHAEAPSHAAQSSGIWELWTVISPKFSTISVFVTIASNREHSNSSPDVLQWGPPNLHQGRSPTAWGLALLVTSLLAHNKLHTLYNQLLSEPAILHSQVLTRVQARPHPRTISTIRSPPGHGRDTTILLVSLFPPLSCHCTYNSAHSCSIFL
jgi:hypothetical protein